MISPTWFRILADWSMTLRSFTLTSKSNTHGPAENFCRLDSHWMGFPVSAALADLHSVPRIRTSPRLYRFPILAECLRPACLPGPGFLPAVFQGTPFNSSQPIRNLQPPSSIVDDQDAAARSLLKLINGEHLQRVGRHQSGRSHYELRTGRAHAAFSSEISDLTSETPRDAPHVRRIRRMKRRRRSLATASWHGV